VATAEKSLGLASAELSGEGLAAIATGHTAFQMLWAATEFDLFSLLSRRGALSLEEIAAEVGLARQPAEILLQGLSALKLLKKNDERDANSAVAESRLVRGRPGCIIPVLGWQHHIVFKGLFDFTASLRQNRNVGLRHFPGSGNTLYERIASNPQLEHIFQESMSCLSKGQCATGGKGGPSRHAASGGLGRRRRNQRHDPGKAQSRPESHRFR
jgi:hypothetical protein